MIKQKVIYSFVVLCILIIWPGIGEAAVNFNSSSGGSINIDMSIVLVGPGATPEYAAKVKQSIEDYWNAGAAGKSCFDMNFTANVQVGNEDVYLELSGNSKQDFAAVGEGVDSYAGSEVWYVTDPKDGYYRSWVGADGNYDGHDSFGAIDGSASAETIVHETGHVLGLDDQYQNVYDENGDLAGFTINEGYETNIMASSPYGNSIEDKFNYTNFENMLKKIEERTGFDIRSCLMLNLKGEVRYELVEHIEDFKTDIDYSITPDYPVITEGANEDSNKLVGQGMGEANWNLVSMPPGSIFLGFSITNNPFTVAANGEVVDSDYNFNMTSSDIYIAQSQIGTYDTGGSVELVFGTADGVCGKSWSSLINGMSLNINEVSSGTICDFKIQHTFYDGYATFEILSIQG